MRIRGVLFVMGAAAAILTGCEGKSAVPAFGVVALEDQPRDGVDGKDGAMGPAGKDGAKGDKGDPGATGPMGPAGKDGAGASVSGSRLKARTRTGEDGSKAFEGWYDSQLDVACSYATAADGKERCLPLSANDSSATLMFSDAACSVPILLVHGGCTPPDYMRSVAVDACGKYVVRIFSSGAAMPAPQPPYVLNGVGACVNFGGALGDFYTASEVAPTAMVAGTLAE